MRFVDPTGKQKVGRRSPTSGSTSSLDASDPKEAMEAIAQVVRELQRRLNDLEAARQPDAIEFDVLLPSSGTVTLAHRFNSTVRWWVTSWRKSSAGSPSLTEVLPGSDANTLILTSGVAGQAVIRIERSQFGQATL